MKTSPLTDKLRSAGSLRRQAGLHSPNRSSHPLLYEAVATAAASLTVTAFSAGLLLRDPHWFWRDDYQSYHLAGYCDMARAWQEGEWPLLSPYSWQGGALAGEYQNGVFSVWLTACARVVFGLGLSLPLAAACLAIIHLAILAAGSFRLGRCRGLPVEFAVLAALVTSLHGWIMLWGARAWFPALASFAWLPWFWWGLHLALDGSRSLLLSLPAGAFLYLIITAGWPFTVLMAAVLSLWFVLRRWWRSGRLLPAWPVLAVWGVGLGLSAPAWLMLLEYAQETVRAQTSPFALNWTWAVPPTSLPGLVFPDYGTFWDVFWAHKPHLCGELTGGLVPVAILVSAWCWAGRSPFRRLGCEFGLGGLSLALAVGPSLGTFRWSFRWLPFFFLVLALTAAHVLAEWHAEMCNSAEAHPTLGKRPLQRPRLHLGLWSVFLVGIVWLATVCEHLAPTDQVCADAACLIVLCLVWTGLEQWLSPSSTCQRWLPSLVVLASAWISYASLGSFLEVPAWDLREVCRPAPVDPTIRYLSVHTWADVVDADVTQSTSFLRGKAASLFLGNTSLYSGVEFINGYSPMQPWSSTALFQFGAHGDILHDPAAGGGGRVPNRIHHLLVTDSGPRGLLELLGVDGLVVADRFAAYGPILEANGWRPEKALVGGMVYHRLGRPSRRVRALTQATVVNERFRVLDLLHQRDNAGAAPVLLVGEPAAEFQTRSFAAARIGIPKESRCAVTVDVVNPASDREALVVFSRPWFPGYRASLNGDPLVVDRLNLILPAVRLPPGGIGRLVLKYRPRSFVLGCWLAVATCSLVLVVSILGLTRKHSFRSVIRD